MTNPLGNSVEDDREALSEAIALLRGLLDDGSYEAPGYVINDSFHIIDRARAFVDKFEE